MTLHPTNLRHDISPEQSARMQQCFEALEPRKEGFWARNGIAILTVVGSVIITLGLLIIFDPMGHAAEVRYQQEQRQ